MFLLAQISGLSDHTVNIGRVSRIDLEQATAHSRTAARTTAVVNVCKEQVPTFAPGRATFGTHADQGSKRKGTTGAVGPVVPVGRSSLSRSSRREQRRRFFTYATTFPLPNLASREKPVKCRRSVAVKAGLSLGWGRLQVWVWVIQVHLTDHPASFKVVDDFGETFGCDAKSFF
jgi:hypothetical protein